MKVVAASRTVPSHGAGDGAPSPGSPKNVSDRDCRRPCWVWPQIL